MEKIDFDKEFVVMTTSSKGKGMSYVPTSLLDYHTKILNNKKGKYPIGFTKKVAYE